VTTLLKVSTGVTCPILTEVSHRGVNPGEIPDQLQQRPFKSLDLSNNRLTGTLRTSFGAYSEDERIQSVSDEQPLSGLIPSTIKRYGSVSVLLGNSFNCRIDKRDLPRRTATQAFTTADRTLLSLFRRAITSLTNPYSIDGRPQP
jgi:hypothetical protein